MCKCTVMHSNHYSLLCYRTVGHCVCNLVAASNMPVNLLSNSSVLSSVHRVNQPLPAVVTSSPHVAVPVTEQRLAAPIGKYFDIVSLVWLDSCCYCLRVVLWLQY